MYRRRKQRNIIILSLTFVLLLMSVGYAAFRTNLKIKGTTRITSLWDVRITNVTSGTPTGSAQNKITPTWSNLTATMEVDLYEQGDAMEYDVTITNNGTIDAVLSDVIGTPSNSNAVLISYTGFTKGEKLYKKGHSGDTKIVHVKIEYNPAYEGGETSGQSTIEFNYTQGEGGDIQPVENAHVLTYNFAENGGSTSTATNAYIVKNTQIDLTPTATKPGYEFVGWNTNKDAQTGLATLSMGDNDITLYAIFRKVYTVTYEKSANVQSISKQSDTCTAYNKAATCNVTLPTITPKAGYTADTWYSGTTAVGHGGDTYIVSNSVTLTTHETANELIFNDQSVNKSTTGSSQTINITGASNGTGSYTYTEKSEKTSGGVDTNYMSISGSVITISGDIPVGTYNYVITATDDNSGATKDATYTITITDGVAPEAQLTSTSTLKSSSQTATLSCTDSVGVVSYYWGTSAPTGSSTYTTVDSTTSMSITKPISASGTYYLSCKDAAGNVTATAASIKYNTYTVNNMLQNLSGTAHSTANYTQVSTGTYLAPKGTTLTLTSIYTIPDGSNSNRYEGASVGAASSTSVTPSKTNPTLNGDTIYSIWFTRNTVNFRYKTNDGTLRETTQNSSGSETYTWATNGDGLVTRSVNGAAASILNSAYRYGASSINLADYNNTRALYISKSGSLAPGGAQWICESGCATANRTFTQAEYNLTAPAGGVTTDEICNAKNNDCTVIIKVNWKTSATVPTAANYCKNNLVYSGSSQELTNNAATGYTFSGNTGTNADDYTVTATLSSGYVWSDAKLADKTFTCSIAKATPIITVSPAAISVGEDATEDFTATVKSGASNGTVSGTLSVVSGTTNVATVSPASSSVTSADDSTGVGITETVTGVNTGTSNITVNFTPDSASSANYNSAEEVIEPATVGLGEYTITISAGPGVSSLTASGWTGSGTGTISKKYHRGDTIDLTTITPTYKTGYSGISYTKENGVGTITNDSFAVERGAATLSYSATALATPTCTIKGGATKVYNRSATTLTATDVSSSYDSDSVDITYSFGYATSGTAALDHFSAAQTANTFSVGKAAFRNTRYYGVTVVVTDKEDSSITSTCTSGTVDSAQTGDTVANRTTMVLVNSRINFNATTNGGTRVGTSPLYVQYGSKNVYTGRTNSTTGTIPLATKDGYTFDGWFTSGGAKVINADRTIPKTAVSGWINSSGNFVKTGTSTSSTSVANTLYAQFTPNSYTIDYTLNGGTGGTNSPVSGTYDSDVQIDNPTKAVTVTGNDNNTGATIGPSVTVNQAFTGWTSSTIGNNAKAGTAASPIGAWDGTSTLNTYFKNLVETGTVTMVANWSSDSITLPKVEKEYYTCTWNTEDDGTGTSYESEATFTPTSETPAGVTLYAQCEAQPILKSVRDAPQLTDGSGLTPDGISKVIFEDNKNIPQGAISWDVSAATGSGAVMAWVTTDPEDSTKYVMHIGADGGVIANTDSSHLFDYFGDLKSVDFNDNFDTSNVTDMSYMFDWCDSLTSIDFDSSFNTSNVTNMESMFHHCSSLTSLDLSSFDTSKVTDMKTMFLYCSGLTSLDLGDNFDTSSVTNMYFMFATTGFTSLDLGDKFDTSNVTNMAAMFQSSSLVSLDLGDKFDTRNVQDMGSMFNAASSLRSLDLGDNFDTRNVQNMGSMFAQTHLTSLDLGDKFDTSNVQIMSSMFLNCSNLTSLDLGKKFDTSKVSNNAMTSMFSGCSSLTSLDLGDNFDTSLVTDMRSMFYNCSSLITLNLGDKFDTSKVANMVDMFRNCSSLTTIYADDKFVTTAVTKSSNSNNMFTGCSNLVGGYGTAVAVKQVYNKTYAKLDTQNQQGYFTKYTPSIMRSWSEFYDDSGTKTWTSSTPDFHNDSVRNTITTIEFVRGINIPQGATSWDVSEAQNESVMAWMSGTTLYIGAEDTIIFNPDSSHLFDRFTNVTSINFNGNINTGRVTTMYKMFEYCQSLTSIDLSSFATAKVTDMGLMFSYCESVGSLDLSGFNTKNVQSMRAMFQKCEQATAIDVSSFNTSSLTDMAGMFSTCTNLTSLNLTRFDTSNVTSMLQLFKSCRNLTELDLRSFDTSNVTTMANMFGMWDGNDVTLDAKLATIRLGSKFDTSKVESMNMMFANLPLLTSLDLSSFDTSQVTSMSQMFQNSNLEEIDVSSFDTTNVQRMASMFNGCRNIEYLDLSNFNTTSVTTMQKMFQNCEKLKEIDLSSFVTTGVTDMSSMFSGCKDMTELDLSSFNTNSVTTTASMFNGMNNIETIYASSAFTNTGITTSTDMFKNANKLVGGNGTSVATKQVYDKTYALVDKSGQEGYFTAGIAPRVAVTSTSSTLRVVVTTDVLDSNITKYEFSKDGTVWEDGGSNNIYTFTGLTKNTSYPISVRVTGPNNDKFTSTAKTYKTTNFGLPTYEQTNLYGVNANVTITFPSGCGTTLTCSYSKDSGASVNVNSTEVTVNFTGDGDLAATVTDGTNTEGSSYTVHVPDSKTIYRHNTNNLAIGDPINSTTVTKYIITNGSSQAGTYDTIEACTAQREIYLGQGMPAEYVCQEQEVTVGGAGTYTENAGELNKTYYLKHDVEDDKITASYVCFVYNNTEHCLKGGDGGASFAANTQIIQDYQTFYNLPDNSNPGCNFYSSHSACYGGGFISVLAHSNGRVDVRVSSSEDCNVNYDGISYCTE